MEGEPPGEPFVRSAGYEPMNRAAAARPCGVPGSGGASPSCLSFALQIEPRRPADYFPQNSTPESWVMVPDFAVISRR